MSDMHIDSVDLNLLRPLEILLRERHVSRAAARAHVTQSAMSRTLARLRSVCEDELLVRTPAGYELTPRARALQEELAELMPSLRALFEGGSFELGTATDVMRIAASDYPVTILGDELFPLFSQEAPKMSLVITPVAPSTFADLEQGSIDLVLTPLAAPPHLHMEQLFSEDFVCVLSSSHPLALRSHGAERLTLADLAAFPHASVGGMYAQQTIVMNQLERLGVRADAELRVPFFSAAVAAVRRTEFIVMVPRRFAERHIDEALRIAEAPEEITGITYAMYWHPRLGEDPAHRWLRELLRRVAATVTADAAEGIGVEGTERQS